MLLNLAISLAINGFGPICDNAGGIVEIVNLEGTFVRLRMPLTQQATPPPQSAKISQLVPQH